MLIVSGSGLLIPMKKPERTTEDHAEILWVGIEQRGPQANSSSARAALPTKDAPDRPATWPRAWAARSEQVQRTWI
jgi:hypothetical protein